MLYKVNASMPNENMSALGESFTASGSYPYSGARKSKSVKEVYSLLVYKSKK